MSESQGNKRPAERDPSPARPNKVSKTQAAAFATAFAQEILTECDPFEVGNIDETIGYQSKPPDDEWTQAQEDRVIEMFQSSGMEQAGQLMYRGGKDKKNYPVLLALFKVCLRVFGLTPVEFISPRYQLRYQSKGNRGKGSPHILSADFCIALSGLIVHPNIGGDSSRLLCLLQFAVICRLDIRRPWVIPLIPDECPVLAQLRRQMKESGRGLLDEPVSLTHRKLRESVGKKGESCSRMSDYLNRISELCPGNGPIPEPDDGSYVHLGSNYKPITVGDLDIVVKAIETTPIEKSDYEYPVKEALKTYREIKKAHEFPSADQLGDVWERSQKQVLRDLIQRADTRPKTPENRAPADSQEGNTGPVGSEPQETSPDVDMAPVPEPEETDPFVAQDVDMVEQSGEEEESGHQLVEEEVATSPEPESDDRSSNGGPSTPAVVHRLRRTQMRLSDMGPLSPTHGSSNPFLFRTSESNELSLRRAQDRDLMQQMEDSDTLNRELMKQLQDSNALNRELVHQLQDSRAESHELRAENRDLMQQLEGSRDQSRDVISGLREEFQDLKAEFVREQEKQSKKNAQFLQKLEEKNVELVKSLEEQSTKLFLYLQSSSSRGVVTATLDPTTVTSPATACSPENLVGNTQDNAELPEGTTDKDVLMDEPEIEPQDKADTVQQAYDLPSKNILQTNLEYGYTRSQVVVSQIGASFRCGIGSIQTRGGTGDKKSYNPLLDITHTEQVERKNRA